MTRPSAVDSILALDAASQTGWAYLDTDGSICSGTKRFTGHDLPGTLFKRYRIWLGETLNELAPALVAYEVPQIGLANRVSGNASRLTLGGLYGVTMGFLAEQQVACMAVSPADAKKAATGRGNAGKRDVLQAIRDKGHDVANADQADAVAILLAAMGKLDMKVAA